MVKKKVDARVEETARSMVIVSETDGPEYCSGFVAITGARLGTYVVTNAEFVKGREQSLKVYFFDDTELPASLIHADGFCLLRTEFHYRCEQIELMKGNLTPSPAIIFPPSSATSFYHLPSFVTAESAESYPVNLKSKGTRIHPTNQTLSSGEYFLVDCHYSEKTSGGHDRLATAPIYTLSRSVMGIVMGSDIEFTCKKLAHSAHYVSVLIESVRTLVSGEKKKRDGDGSSKDEESDRKKRNKGGDKGSFTELSGNKSIPKSSSNDKERKGAGHEVASGLQ